MRSNIFALAAALAAGEVAAHATFQALWVDGVDFGAQCARLPTSNSPITDANQGPAARKCGVKAGGKVTIEMHQVRSGERAVAVFWEREGCRALGTRH